MGKAFTEEERMQIKKQIMDVAYQLFTEQGVEKVNIREITSKVGIAQGGFYSFFKNKEDLVFTILDEYHRTKAEYVLSLLPGTEKDPIDFIKEIIMHNSSHMYHSKIYWNEKQDILFLLSKKSERENEITMQRNKEALAKMIAYWKQHGREVVIDEKKLLAVLNMTACMAVNKQYIGSKEFEPLFSETVDYLVHQCMQVVHADFA